MQTVEKRKQLEQRWSERRNMALAVTLNLGGERLQHGTCRDLGVGGMFVETDLRALTHNAPLLVDLVYAHRGAETAFRLPARVAHISSNGAGLMFSDLRPDVVRALCGVLYG